MVDVATTAEKEKDPNAKSTLYLDVEYQDKISRLFIFRPLWMLIEMWVIWVWSIWYGLVTFVHFWYMLILGKRSEAMWKKQLRFFRHMSKWQAYLMWLTNERPKFIED